MIVRKVQVDRRTLMEKEEAKGREEASDQQGAGYRDPWNSRLPRFNAGPGVWKERAAVLCTQ